MEELKQIIMICNLESLDRNILKSSSSKYEYDFADEVSTFVNKVSVFSPKAKEYESERCIELVPVEMDDLRKDYGKIIRIIEKAIQPKYNTVIQMFGYDPKLILALNRLKKRFTNVKLSTIIYDTHLGVLGKKSMLRKLAICSYYSLGLLFLGMFDKVLLFKKKAAKRLRLKKEYCVIVPDVKENDIQTYHTKNNDKVCFMYAGTLCEYNNIQLILDAFSSIKWEEAELKIFGDGNLQALVIKAAEVNPAIKYYGRVSSEVVKREMEIADVLLNIRTVPSVVNDYAFPSKLIESLSEGKAVISTNVSDYDGFDKAVFLLDTLDAEELRSIVESIIGNPGVIKEKVEQSKAYLLKYHNRNIISKKITEYLFS